jgi:hypothetical protein
MEMHSIAAHQHAHQIQCFHIQATGKATCDSIGITHHAAASVVILPKVFLHVASHGHTHNGRGTGPGTAAHWEAQPPVVAQGAAAALRTRPLPQPTASSLVVESWFLATHP